MKTNTNKEHSAAPSPEEIRSYINGELSPEEMHRVEQQLEDDPFSYEAMEGFEEQPNSVDQISELSEVYHKHFTPSWYQTAYFKWSMYSLSSLILIGSFFFSSTNEQVVTPTTHTPIPEVIEDKSTDIPEKTITPIQTPIQSKPIVKINTKKKTNKKTTAAVTASPVKLRNLSPIYLTQIRYSKIVSPLSLAPIRKTAALERPYDIFIIEGLEVVNLFYHNFYHDPDEMKYTAASISHPDDTEIIPEDHHNGVTTYTYGDFMQIALKEYKSKRYLKAIENLQIILEQYPKDVNAEYYLGLCFYRQNKSEKALEYLNLVQNNAISYFDNDAKLYAALCYKKLGDKERCKNLLQEVIEKKGKNKKTAEEILSHL